MDSALPVDGMFDSSTEDFKFTTPTLAGGTHTIEVRALNTAGNWETAYSSDALTIAVESSGTVIRSFSSPIVAPGATTTVTLTPGGVVTEAFYMVVETLPPGFTFGTTSVDSTQDGQVVTFISLSGSAFTYTATAPLATGTFTFSGTFKDANLDTGIVGGSSVILVGAGLVYNVNKDTYYPTIQEAIDNASPGNEIHVDSGTYNESVNITKMLILRGIGMPVVNAGGSGSAITLSADGIALEGFTATNATTGISVTSNDNTLSGNNAKNGISLVSSSNNMLIGNTANSNCGEYGYDCGTGGGISLSSSINNMLIGNTANWNFDHGISLFSSNNNTLNNNNANGNWGDTSVGISLSFSSNNKLNSNNANGNGDWGTGMGISLSSSNNNTLNNNNANENYGIGAIDPYGGVYGHAYGISLASSSDNTLIYNNANRNGAFYKAEDGYGIFLSSSSNNTLIGNNANSNENYGISLFSSSNNTLSGNNANSNINDGISLSFSSNNPLSGNNASNNEYGIYLFSSSNNKIYHNHLINNYYQAYDDSNNNLWDNGYPSGGNYWNDYTGVDLKSGPGQNIPGSDGIGDILYSINGGAGAQDRYPLMDQIANLIKNPGFEFGTANWSFYTNGTGAFSIISPGYEGNNAAKLALTSGGTSIQLYQPGITLEPKTIYQLSFAAYSTTGHDMDVRLYQHVSPYADYGLNETFDLGTSWQTFTTEFISTNITNKVNDARLIFWLANFAAAGDTYYIDDVRLEKANAPKLPTITTQPLNQTVNAGQTANFTVVATGTSLSYQWQKNGTNIPGATSASYTTAPTTMLDNGSTYRVNVTNPGGSLLSNSATLTVILIPLRLPLSQYNL